jgi:hypothetical protein
MGEINEKHTDFAGTYFDRDAVLRLSKISVVLGWIIFLYNVFQWLFMVWQNVSGALQGGYPIDYSFLIFNMTQLLQGAMLLVFLLIGSRLLLIFLDIEDNSRRTARHIGDSTK